MACRPLKIQVPYELLWVIPSSSKTIYWYNPCQGEQEYLEEMDLLRGLDSMDFMTRRRLVGRRVWHCDVVLWTCWQCCILMDGPSPWQWCVACLFASTSCRLADVCGKKQRCFPAHGVARGRQVLDKVARFHVASVSLRKNWAIEPLVAIQGLVMREPLGCFWLYGAVAPTVLPHTARMLLTWQLVGTCWHFAVYIYT